MRYCYGGLRVWSNEKFAKKLKKLFGDEVKEVKIDLLYQEEVNKYIMEIEEAHKKAAHSKLMFGYAY